LGRNGELRRNIQQTIPVRIIDRGTKVVVLGDSHDTELVREVLLELLISIRNGHTPTKEDVDYALNQTYNPPGPKDLGQVLSMHPVLRGDIDIIPRTRGQKRLLDSVSTNELTFAIGPAGSGKTFLAMAAAVSALLNKEVERLVLTRPAVEAGENLGFLPGDMKDKVDPYLQPLYDALNTMVDSNTARRFFEREQVEVAPLAFMRGRTLSKCFAILDEAQNTSSQQMKMFLTRLGKGSKAIVTGDVTQVDLPPRQESGLIHAQRILHGTKGIGIVQLDKSDIVRHQLVQRIVEAYEGDEPTTSQSDEPASFSRD
jgi:phosphate starvation-inducible PhoH-like protein